MIHVSISYGFGPENRYKLVDIPVKVQLAIYKYKLYEEFRNDILRSLKDNTTIRAVHLPLDTCRIDAQKIFTMMDEIYARTGCAKFVVHPNKGFEDFILSYNKMKAPMNLCIETFNWRRHKVLRSPLDIIQAIWKYGRSNLSMTLDTTHIEDVWYDHKIMRFLLQYTSVIHLSNRAAGIGEHLPFNHPKGELPLVKFVRELKHQYKWSGDIVLEYMPEYHNKLIKNAFYVERLLS